MFFPNKAVLNFGLDVPNLSEDPKLLEQIRNAWTGELIAWDPVKQAPAWKHAYANAGNGGTLSTGGNLVFQGTADGRVVAYSADKGTKLWEHRANSGVMAGPVSYTVKGEQYIAFSVGWGGVMPRIAGPLTDKGRVQPESRVIAFKLDAKEELPPPKNAPLLPKNNLKLSASTDDLTKARDMFNGFCAGCHGLNAISGGVVPDLRYLTEDKHKAFPAFLSGARMYRGMPSFADVLKPEDMELIRQYIIKRTHDLKAELNVRTGDN